MGRELAEIHMDKKKSDGEHAEEKTVAENGHENEDVLRVKSINIDTDTPEGKKEKHGAQRSKNNKQPSSPSSKSHDASNNRTDQTEKHALSLSLPNGVAAANTSEDAKDASSPTSAKNSQTNSPTLTPRKQLEADHKKHIDEEDGWSVASSAATSGRRSKVTVGSAPTFRSAERAEKRKEFYHRLEEKQQALEEERSQYEQRTKEEEAAALKQLRKSLVVKANPIPSFYYEGAPPKVELKKLPLTRPKSPKLHRRRSFSDVSNSVRDEKSRQHPRCSVRKQKEDSQATTITRKVKPHTTQNSPRAYRVKDKKNNQVKETMTEPSSPDMTEEQANSDIENES